MLDRISAIVRKEFIQIVRDPRTLAIVVLQPILQIVLFGYAINTTVDHIATVVADQARDGESRRFVQAFVATGFFDVVAWVEDAQAIRSALDSGVGRVGLVIPPGFSDDVAAGRQALAQLVIDGSDPNVAQTALFTGGAIAQARAADLLLTSIGRRGQPIAGPPIELRPVVLYNPAMASVNFMIPGLIGMILQFQTLVLTAFAIVRERERGTLEQLVVTPIKPWELMLGKIVPYVLIAFLNVGIATAVGVLWFQIDFAGSLSLLLGLSVFFLLGSLGIGLLISTVSRTQTQAMQLAVFVILPSFMISGFVFPRESMPGVIYALSSLVPLTYFLQILRGIILKGVGLDSLWWHVWPLAVFGLAVFVLSVRRFQKKLD
ncbi:MAG: ABC transporter permease [Chloroflexi bacterium]|nr:ABC transporter permease [Chloroflexota bacterium]